MTTLSITSTRVLLPDGTQPALVRVEDGRIAAIDRRPASLSGPDMIDAGDLIVMPGLVDVHVHINEPGRTEWEGFESATRAAAAGGVTTLVDMPLNSVPPTTTVEALNAKQRAAKDQLFVDVAFWGGVVPGNAGELGGLARAGVAGFKCFLAPSGVEEFQHVEVHDLRIALPILAWLDKPLLVHAELPAELLPARSGDDPRKYGTWLDSRPVASERAAIELIIELAREYRARVHIVHLSSPDSLEATSAARAGGVRISVETCPHYLTFSADDIGEGATPFKCAPPIRDARHRDGLWQGLAAGQIDLVATDHSPAPPSMKSLEDGDFLRAWGGISSLQLGLSAVWSGAADRGITLESIARWMASSPAQLAGLDGRKGSLTVGADADLVVWDPDAWQIVDGRALQHRHPVTPYHGMRLRGRVRTTLLRGEVVFDDGVVSSSRRGRIIPLQSPTAGRNPIAPS
jgi:allantoinase